MPEANRSGGDPKLILLFEEYGGRLVSPGGAASARASANSRRINCATASQIAPSAKAAATSLR
jgi:hypothetical protein